MGSKFEAAVMHDIELSFQFSEVGILQRSITITPGETG